MRALRATLLAFVAIPISALAGSDRYSYCDDYLRFLNTAVYNMRIGAPISPDTFKDPDGEWPQALRFINEKPRGYDFREWINQKYLRCWEETPYGPGS